MRLLGEYILRGRLHAALAVSLLTFVSWFLPPLTYLVSGAPVGFLTLRRGGALAAQVVVISFALIALLAVLAGINPQVGGFFALAVWSPVWLCSLVLRLTESHAWTILAAAGIGLLFALVMRLVVDDVGGWWSGWFQAWLQQQMTPEAAAPYAKMFETAAPWLNALVAAGLATSLIATLLVARWWQARMFNPGGFRGEFHALRLPRGLVLPMLGALAFVGLQGPQALPAITDLFVLLMLAYLFQGIATVHRTVGKRGLSGAWLVGMYGLLVLLPQMFLFLACLGMADSWLRPRKPPGDGAAPAG